MLKIKILVLIQFNRNGSGSKGRGHVGLPILAAFANGSAPFMYWELFRRATGVDMVLVPYHGGGPVMIDLIAGRVQVFFGTFASTMQNVRAGKLRALAVTSAIRVPALPDIPAVAEFLPGFEASIYVGVAAPHGTHPDIVATLAKAMNDALTDPKVTQKIADLGDAPLATSTTDFTRLIADETKKWRKVIRAENIKAE